MLRTSLLTIRRTAETIRALVRKDNAGILIFIVVLLILIFLFMGSILEGFAYAVNGWTHNPLVMVSKIAFSFLFGQAIFWIFGYDQIGIFMNPKKELGLGIKFSRHLQKYIHPSAKTAWLIKIIEIITDLIKAPIEGFLYLTTGIVPDALANLVTQPFWSIVETAEKISGTIIHPERVAKPEQVKLSISCIYGNLFRYLLTAFLFIFGLGLYEAIGVQIEVIINSI